MSNSSNTEMQLSKDKKRGEAISESESQALNNQAKPEEREEFAKNPDETSPKVNDSGDNLCIICKNKEATESSLCENCQDDSNKPEEVKEPSKKKKYIFVGICILVALGIGYLIYRGGFY